MWLREPPYDFSAGLVFSLNRKTLRMTSFTTPGFMTGVLGMVAPEYIQKGNILKPFFRVLPV
jgi:hypothetical protein